MKDEWKGVYMAVYLCLTAAVILLAYLVDNRESVKLHREPEGCEMRIRGPVTRQQSCNFWAAAGIFVLLTAVSACRIAVGNDYWVYRYQFNLIMQERHVSYESGFNLVVWIIQWLFGYDNYLPVFGFFSIVTCFFFVKAMKDQSEWFAGTVFLLMTGGYYFSSLNSVRYYLVLAIAMYSMKYVTRGEYGKFILWILAASTFHKSVLLVIPVYLLAKWLADRKLQKWHYFGGGILAASLILGQDLYRKVIFLFYPYYENSAFDTGDLSLVNIAKCVGVLLLTFICWRTGVENHKTNRFYFFLNVAGLMVYTCGSFIPEVSRIGYYMIISQIFLIPGLLKGMKKGILRNLCMAAVVIAFMLYFAMFLYKAQNVNIRLLPYLNWIFN